MLIALPIGCARPSSSIARVTLPPLKTYTPAQQAQAAREIKEHGAKVPMLVELVSDYGDIRAAIRLGNEIAR